MEEDNREVDSYQIGVRGTKDFYDSKVGSGAQQDPDRGHPSRSAYGPDVAL
jgi:hypothetical protein